MPITGQFRSFLLKEPERFGFQIAPRQFSWFEQRVNSKENAMPKRQEPTAEGDASAKALIESTKKEERRIERQKGSPLAKGAKRVEERSKSSDGKSAGDKQKS